MLVKYDLDAKGTGHVFERTRLVAAEDTEYQSVEISDLDILGRVLVLDNIIQLSALDCDRYHEVFAHLPMSCITAPRKALVLGGGDGILAKELLKYEGMTVDMVDIDQRVCDLSREHLTELHGGSFDDPRLNLYYQDALEFCSSNEEKYDVIYADITDPHPDSPSKSLLSQNAIMKYKSLLTKEGILVAQTDNVQIAPDHYKNIMRDFGACFTEVGNFATVALTLSSIFSFVWASDETKVVPRECPVPTSWLDYKRSDFCFKVLELCLGDDLK